MSHVGVTSNTGKNNVLVSFDDEYDQPLSTVTGSQNTFIHLNEIVPALPESALSRHTVTADPPKVPVVPRKGDKYTCDVYSLWHRIVFVLITTACSCVTVACVRHLLNF